MNSILVSPRGRGQEPGRILAIESDPERSKTLEQVLRGHVRAHLVVVKSVDQAIRSMTDKLPDLILTSPFLKPAEEAALSTHLRRTPPAAHVQVITVPHSIETDDDAGRSTPPRMLGFLRRRSTAPSACAPDTLRNEIEAYLVEAARGPDEAVRRALRFPVCDDRAGPPNGAGPRANRGGSERRPAASPARRQ